jgi:hypothetical protein
MFLQNAKRHNKTWCRATRVLAGRKNGPLEKVHLSHLNFLILADVKRVRGITALYGDHLDAKCIAVFGWYTHSWTNLVLALTSGGRFSKVKRIKLLVELSKDIEFQDFLLATEKLAGRNEVRIFLEDHIGKTRRKKSKTYSIASDESASKQS